MSQRQTAVRRTGETSGPTSRPESLNSDVLTGLADIAKCHGKEARGIGPAPRCLFSILQGTSPDSPLIIHTRRPLMPALLSSTGHPIATDRAQPGRHLLRHDNRQLMTISWPPGRWADEKQKQKKRKKPPCRRPNQRTHPGHRCDSSGLISRPHSTHTKETPQKQWEGTGLLACTMRYTTRHHAAQSRNGNGARAAPAADRWSRADRARHSTLHHLREGWS